MNEWLAQMYNTNGTGEELEKQAEMDLFCKLAAENNIDLSQMSGEEVGALYATVFPKYAQEGEGEKKEEEETEEEKKKKKAEEYVEEKKAFQEKFAEADLMGRVMAHSFTQELGLIKQANETSKEAKWTQVGRGGQQVWKDPTKLEKGLEAAGKGAKRVFGDVPGALKSLKAARSAQKANVGAAAKHHAGEAWKKGKRAVGIAGGAAALGAGGAVAAKEKKSSAEQFEELSAQHAVKVAAAADYDVDEAVERVSAVYTLGLEETEKVAHVQDFEDAIHVRGLEYLEAAGYPVKWSEVFGEE